MSKSTVARRGIRFPPDPGTFAVIDFAPEGEKSFTVYGLVVNESHRGCAVVILTDRKLKKDMHCVCRVGNLSLTKANVRWIKRLETGLLKVGLEYLK